MVQAGQQLRYLTLWLTFALLLVLFPFVHGTLGSVVFTVLFTLVLVSSASTISKSRMIRNFTLVLVFVSVAARWTYLLVGGSFLDAISFLLASLTLTLVSFLMFLSLFETKEVTSSTLWEGISVYLLIGFTWACIFACMNVVAPGSFKDSVFPDTPMTFPALIYYSFVTMTTLGYGDILPTTQQARGFVILEVLMGVLYMAILVSRLVGTWKPGGEDQK